MRIQFDAVTAPAGLFGGEQRGAAAGKCIQDNAASLGTVEDSVTNQGDGFRRRVSGKRGVPVPPETTHTGIFPNICSASPEAAELDVVDVLSATIFVDEDELMGRPVQ